MALIQCPDCGKMFSEYAECCPVCGCPTEEVKAELFSHEDIEVEESKPTPLIEESPVNGNMTNLYHIGEGYSRWKNYIIIALVVVGGVFFVYHQCSKNEPSKDLSSDANMTITEQFTDDKEQTISDVDATVVEHPSDDKDIMHNINDLYTFKLKGKVESVTYNTESPINIYFDEVGDVCYIKKYLNGDKSNVSNAIIKRNSKEEIKEIRWEGDPWYSEFCYSYNDDGTYSDKGADYVWTNGMGNRTEYRFIYNERGHLSEIVSTEYVHGEKMGIDRTKVEVKKVDSEGNWIERTCAIEDDVKVITRTIVYYK